MPSSRLQMIMMLIPGVLTACTVAPRGAAAPSSVPAVVNGRATAGDTVAIAIYRVQAEKREQYEHFLHQVFWPMGRRLGETDAVMRRVFGQTRILHPEGPNEDGTYSYAFLFDPWETGGEYSIEALLKRGFGEQEGARVYREQFQASLAGSPHYFFQFRQSRH